MRRIRVIQLVAGLAIGDQSGGAEYFGAQLARHVDRQEFEVAVFAMWRYGSAPEKRWLSQLADEGIPVAGLIEPTGAIARQLRAITSDMWSFVGDFKPDIINSHSQRGDPLNLAVRWLHPLHPRSVRTVHIDQPWLNRRYMDIVCNRCLFPVVFDREVAISEEVRRKLNNRIVARLLGRRSDLCYNGISAETFHAGQQPQPCCTPSWPPPEMRPCIAVIGRLAKQKGHADLLHAMQFVRQQRHVHLVVIGSGPLNADLQRQTRELNLEDCVHFLGSRDDVIELLPNLDLVVSSSLWEGLPTVLLEAMALRVPVVATDISGTRELVQSGITGLLVPSGKPEQLAEAILNALAHPDAARAMAENAHRFAAQFTIERVAQRYAQMYRALVSDRL